MIHAPFKRRRSALKESNRNNANDRFNDASCNDDRFNDLPSPPINRRDVIMCLLTASATTFADDEANAYPGPSLGFSNNIDGNPNNNGNNGNTYEIEDDPEGKKIILQMSSKNIPQKYSSKPSGPPTPINNEDGSVTIPTPTQTNSNVESDSNNDSYFSLTETESRRIDVFQKAAPSVVYIDTFVEQRDAFSTNVMEVPLGTGSGFVWDEKGHIVTNYHVVRNAQSAQVAILTKIFHDEVDLDGQPITNSPSKSPSTSSNVPAMIAAQKRQKQKNKADYDPDVTDFTRKNYKARVIGVDPGKDLAVLKIDAPVFDLYPIQVGTSKGLRVGQSAFAIGNPFGLDHTLTVGVVSGIGREVKSPIGRPITNVIQTDAAINPGNSGGPLLDSSGKLIGINTSIFSPSGASAGIGFAIPVDSVKFIVETLIRDRRVVRPILGITYLESKQAKALGINKGVLVLDVPKNSAAFAAGMRGTSRTESGLIGVGDIIIKIEDYKINTEADLFEALESFKPGDIVKVTVNRPDLETPNSTKLQLRQKEFNIQLRSSSDTAMARYLFPNP